METTIVKTNNALRMKEDIKALATEQKFLRNQRKSEHIVGERKMPASEAETRYRYNTRELRIMYAAYGLLRGKSFSYTENHYQEENHPLNNYKYEIDKLLNKYKIDAIK